MVEPVSGGDVPRPSREDAPKEKNLFSKMGTFFRDMSYGSSEWVCEAMHYTGAKAASALHTQRYLLKNRAFKIAPPFEISSEAMDQFWSKGKEEALTRVFAPFSRRTKLLYDDEMKAPESRKVVGIESRQETVPYTKEMQVILAVLELRNQAETPLTDEVVAQVKNHIKAKRKTHREADYGLPEEPIWNASFDLETEEVSESIRNKWVSRKSALSSRLVELKEMHGRTPPVADRFCEVLGYKNLPRAGSRKVLGQFCKETSQEGTCLGQTLTLLGLIKQQPSAALADHLSSLGHHSQDLLSLQGIANMAVALRNERDLVRMFKYLFYDTDQQLQRRALIAGIDLKNEQGIGAKQLFARETIKKFAFMGDIEVSHPYLLNLFDEALLNHNSSQLSELLEKLDYLIEMDLEWFPIADHFGLPLTDSTTLPWAKSWELTSHPIIDDLLPETLSYEKLKDELRGTDLELTLHRQKVGWKLDRSVYNKEQAIQERRYQEVVLNTEENRWPKPAPLRLIESIFDGLKEGHSAAFRIQARSHTKGGHAVLLYVRQRAPQQFAFYDIYGVGGFSFPSLEQLKEEFIDHMEKGYLGQFLEEPGSTWRIDQMAW